MRGFAWLVTVSAMAFGVGCGPKAWERPGTQAGQEITGPDGGAMVWVPAGDFTMGSSDYVGNPDERPQRKATLPGFWIDKTETTNEQYARFLQHTKQPRGHAKCMREELPNKDHTPEHWTDAECNGPKQPVIGVDWYDASAYAAWSGQRLPTEPEWEKAARGTDARAYPWGNSWDATKCANTSKTPTRRDHQEMIRQLFRDDTAGWWPGKADPMDVWLSLEMDKGLHNADDDSEFLPLPGMRSGCNRARLVECFGEPTSYTDGRNMRGLMVVSDGRAIQAKVRIAWYGAIGFGLAVNAPEAPVVVLAYDPPPMSGPFIETPESPGRTEPVGSHPADLSPYGCLDMAGSACEWCADRYEFGGQTETERQQRVIRGGSWRQGDPWLFRTAYRSQDSPDAQLASYLGFRGFRCAITPKRQ